MDKLIETDKLVTNVIYKLFNNNPYISSLPYYLGLLPYELYVLPGMYISILQVIWFSAFNPIQFHLFPHFFAYSIFQFLKGAVNRKRPGCAYKKMSHYIDDSHCNKKNSIMSFPSGHTGIAFALASALFAEMVFSNNPKFFDIDVKGKYTRTLIWICGLFVALMISIHRISKGYHYVGDVITGAILGSSLGFISWSVLNIYKGKLEALCKKEPNVADENCAEMPFGVKFIFKDNNLIVIEVIIKIILSIVVLWLFSKFLTTDMWKLASIKH